MTAREVLLVVNPAARNGRARNMVGEASEVLRSHGWSVEVVVTRSAAHAVQVGAGADPEKQLLLALGGDGLMARVAEGAVRSGAVVAPLPGGRGCDFIRAIGGSRDLREAAERLPFATERRVDIGMAGEVPFLGVATVGYDSLANHHANEAPARLPGGLVYVYGGARALLESRPTSITMSTDGVTRSFRGWGVAIGNSGHFGAGMIATPGASLEDGRLAITTVEGLPRWRYPLLLPRYFRGTQVDGVDIRGDHGQEVEVSAPEGYRVYADGDLVGRTPMTFTVLPGALRILA
ncbi:diacylglycerol/lipid kinase family protein [Janibacter corallicola]|uniref:diacylglycerol/lipid kinase family protein n=1 Tax=Janibacter corallicola TaxID=415212 RepID=UPI00082A63A3|nr:diacylglycerol kinase family protein [Janibacter corallicola]